MALEELDGLGGHGGAAGCGAGKSKAARELLDLQAGGAIGSPRGFARSWSRRQGKRPFLIEACKNIKDF